MGELSVEFIHLSCEAESRTGCCQKCDIHHQDRNLLRAAVRYILPGWISVGLTGWPAYPAGWLVSLTITMVTWISGWTDS